MADGDDLQSPLKLVVLIGDDLASVQTVLRGLPRESSYAVLATLPPSKERPQMLAAATTMSIELVTKQAAVEAGHVFVVDADLDVVVDRAAITVSPATTHGARDRMLRSVAEHYGRDAAVIVLAGRDGDGALGIRSIRESGGMSICQRVEEGPLASLPRAAVTIGMVDIVVPVEEIADRLTSGLVNVATSVVADVTRNDDTMRDILAMIRIRTGHDFTWYKRATLYRRLARRMQVCQADTIHAYHRLLRENPTELLNLLRDFLISVTNFFRDPEAFEHLAIHVIPRLFHNKDSGDQVRVWVAGCATGEEAYSIGMLLVEHAARIQDPPQLQIFATDIDEDALQEARAGFYPEQIATDVSPERLQRFFTPDNGGYRVNKELRELMLFSPHNLLRDPPFSRLDLISCRNLLIYLNRDAQERVLNTFHFALRSDGILFLGSSESAEGMQQFSPLNARNRIFERRIAPSSLVGETLNTTARWTPSRPSYPVPVSERPTVGSFGELHHRAVERYAPPSVLVNEELDIVHMSEHVGKYFTLAGGEPTRQILRLVHPALRFELRGALYAARQASKTSDTRVIRFEEDGQPRAVEVRVRAVALPEAGRGTMLVIFDELDEVRREVVAGSEANTDIEPVVRELEEQLQRTREQLRTTIEQYETSLEELKASNEELHAINEELRSATEELETSKEELQSVNEELTTLNHELKVKIDEVSHANSDLQNLMASTDIGVLFLDRQLSIKRYTPRIQDIINVIASDLGRPLAHLTHRLDYNDLPQAAAQVLVDLRSSERELTSVDGRRFLVRLLPYRSIEDRIEGVVVTFIDITDLKLAQEARTRSEAALRTSEERLTFALNAAPLAVICHNGRLEPMWAFVNGKQLGATSLSVPNIFASGDSDRYQAIIRDVYATGSGQRAELAVIISGSLRMYDFRIEATREGHLVTGVTSVGFDISPSKQAEAALRENDRHKDEFIAMLSHELRNPLTPLRVALDVAKRAQNNPEKLANAIVTMDRQLEVVCRLVDDLLDLSRIAQGKIELVPTQLDPVTIAEAGLEASRPLFETHHHDLTVRLETDGALIVGDFTRLTQIVTNLLTNAAKYTPDGGAIAMSMTLDDARRQLALEVRDNGIGLSPDDLARVFDMFEQAPGAERRRDGGLGIGLALVRKIAELHGGSASASSDGPGRGSTFRVLLPVVRA